MAKKPKPDETYLQYVQTPMRVDVDPVIGTRPTKSSDGTEGILIPVGYDEHKIPELYPEENPLPRIPQVRKPKEFKSEEERQEHLRRRREISSRCRARKREAKEVDNNQDPQKTAKPSRRKEPNVSEAEQPRDDPRLQGSGYAYAEPYTVQTRWHDNHEEIQRNENTRLAALDVNTMLQPVAEFLREKEPLKPNRK